MSPLIDKICHFLKEKGFCCSRLARNGLDCISVSIQRNQSDRLILPLNISAEDPQEAETQAKHIHESIKQLMREDGDYPLIVTEDRWNIQNEMMKARILSHLDVFNPIYARNCEARKIDKATAKEFLEKNHTYGHAACRYCYGLFFKRHTGHIAQDAEKGSSLTSWQPDKGELMAVATFSNARKWAKGDKTIRSYEWTRYASLPQVRLSGGMGRLLKAFINDVQPDDIMSYADLEWSEGAVYSQLGFELEGRKDPVTFEIDACWQRIPIKKNADKDTHCEKTKYFQNLGSNKYRLKLTDYE